MINSYARQFRFLRYGFNLLAVYWIFRVLIKPDGFNLENIAISSLFIFSVLLFILQIYLGSRRGEGFIRLDGITKVFFALMLVVCAITFFRGFTFDAKKLLTLFLNPIVGGSVWILPLFILVGVQRGVFDALMPLFRRHIFLSMAFSFVSIFSFYLGRSDIAYDASKLADMLAYPAFFILLCGLGTNAYRRPFYIALILLTFCHFFLVGRLGFAVSLSVLIISLMLGNSRSSISIRSRIVSASLLIIPFVFFVVWDAVSSQDDWVRDTRSFLFDELILDFSAADLVFGRGALGTYFSEYFYILKASNIEGGDNEIRQVSEVGYLHILLKAGLLGVFAFLLLNIRALMLANRIGSPRVGFALFLFLFMRLVAMSVGYHLIFDHLSIITWIIVGFIFSEYRLSKNHYKRPKNIGII